MIATKCPYDELPGIFKRAERGEKKYLYFGKPIVFFDHHLTLITQRITFKGESKLIYMLGHLGVSPFN